MFKKWLHFCFYIGQKNVQDLQSAVDSLQKEKEDLILALQSAKKDTNQAKYEHVDNGLFSLSVSVLFDWILVTKKAIFKPLSLY